MVMRCHAVVSFTTVLAFTVALPALVQGQADSTRAPRFYHARPYGSESQFNPLSQIINEGLSSYALVAADLRLSQQPLAQSLRNLGASLSHPGPTLDGYGWPRLVRNELLPLSAQDGGQWVPNWQDHVLGSGMVSARMTEWFAYHGVPHPAVMSYLTMTASHVLNEVMERPGPRSADAVLDLLLFDNLGFLLFRSERVQGWVSGPVQLTSWARQPTITTDGAIENTGTSFILRAPLPRTTAWRLFYAFANTHLLGASRSLGDGLSISAGAGWGSNIILVTDAATDTRTVTLGPKAGVFLDRDDSLLASLLWDRNRGSIAVLNVYPGWLGLGALKPGFWVGIPERGARFRGGITARLGIGIAPGSPER